MKFIVVQYLNMRNLVEMNKNDAINEILTKIYNYNAKLIIPENDVGYINEYYKNNFEKALSYDDLCKDEKFSNIINKLHSAQYEIKKQLQVRKALQPGIISECNFSETLAKILKLNKVIDLDNAKYNDVPKEFGEYVQSTNQTFSGARYLFYNPKDKGVFIFQYGNPALGDAEIVFEGVKIRLEYKERSAKLGEYDIMYHDDGKLIPSEKIKNELNVLVLLIDSFNENTDIFSEIGHNYNSFDKDACIVAANAYIESKNIDLIISSVDGELVAIDRKCFGYTLGNGEYAVSLKGSEIRTSGKNNKKVWTKEHFNSVLERLNVRQIGDSKVFIENNDSLIEFAKARGKAKISRLKINNIYYLDIENIKEKDDGFVFDINDVKQLVPTISMHMYIEANKNELKKILIEKYL